MIDAWEIKRYRSVSELDNSAYPALQHVIAHQLAVWPGHEPAIATSLGNQPADVMAEVEEQALIVTQIAEHHFGGLGPVCEGYRYFCENMILEAELHFRRHGRYERSTFAEALRDVYSQPDVMEKYMNGLLLSGIFWSNHARALHFYRTTFLPMLPDGFAHLEIGPGHGALLHLTATHGRHGRIEAWDVSPSSIEATRRTLETIGIADDVTLVCQDMMQARSAAESFDSIVVSELLEHLEDPLAALRALRPALKPGGLILVNMPANSPAPDHLYLIDKPEEMTALMREAGYEIAASALFPMTGYSLERCIKDRLTITCIAIGRKSH